MVRATSKVLLFISLGYLFVVDLSCGYAIDDGNSVRRRNPARDYAVPHEHPTREDLFDLDWEQVDERYDPRLLSEDLINESQSDTDRKDDSHRRQAEHCYFEARKYEHGQKIPRSNPCEACICVDGETFCWWKQCEPTKKVTISKKAKLFTKPFSATTGGGGDSSSGKTTTSGGSSSAGGSAGAAGGRRRSKKLPLNILNFPKNLPVHLSEIDLMIESDGGTRSPTILPTETTTVTTTMATTPTTGTSSSSLTTVPPGNNTITAPAANRPITPVPDHLATASTANYGDETTSNKEDNKPFGQLPATPIYDSLGRPRDNSQTPATGALDALAINRNPPQRFASKMGTTTKEKSNNDMADVGGGRDQMNKDNLPDDEQTSGHQMAKNINDVKTSPKSTIIGKAQVDNEDVDNDDDDEEGNGKRAEGSQQQWTGEPLSASSSSASVSSSDIEQSADEDVIRKISIDDDSPLAQHYIITSSGDIENIPLANQHIVSQFRENFINEIMPLNSVEKAVRVDSPPPPPTLILDTYPESLVTGPAATTTNNAESTVPIVRVDNHVQSTAASGPTTLAASSGFKIFMRPTSGTAHHQDQQQQQTLDLKAKLWSNDKESAVTNNKNQEPVCIVMGQTYSVGMVLPQEVGNCLQCVCVAGSRGGGGGEGVDGNDPAARVTCSPHNCPPLILPDLFDTTGY